MSWSGFLNSNKSSYLSTKNGRTFRKNTPRRGIKEHFDVHRLHIYSRNMSSQTELAAIITRVENLGFNQVANTVGTSQHPDVREWAIYKYYWTRGSGDVKVNITIEVILKQPLTHREISEFNLRTCTALTVYQVKYARLTGSTRREINVLAESVNIENFLNDLESGTIPCE